VDIGCGMTAVQTNYRKSDLPEDLTPLRESIESRVPRSAGGYNGKVKWGAEEKVDVVREMMRDDRQSELIGKLDSKWPLQMGTLGSGNHFIEVVLDESDCVWAFLHSGSRGVGNRLAEYHIKVARSLMERYFISLPNSDLAYLVEGTTEYDNYLEDLAWAQEFAFCNRAEMMDRVLNAIGYHAGEVEERQRIDCHHNYTAAERYGNRQQDEVLVSRKGAISARVGEYGLIPGSMGTRSYVVQGKGNETAFNTAPHGAGRRLSRRKARESFTMEDFDRWMEGIEVRRSDAFLDELPGAYKDIDDVMEQSSDLVDVVHTFRQIVNVKGA
jgi:tRNA-splicing ligase RtcB